MSDRDPNLPFGRYRDADGCLYHVYTFALSSEDKSELVIVQHVWPGLPVMIAEPRATFDEHFTSISEGEYQAASTGDRAAGLARLPADKRLVLSGEGLPGEDRPFGRYRHTDGGLYLVTGFALTPRGNPLVIYRHLWPFEQERWARPLTEWTPARFAGISEGAYLEAVAGDRQAARAAITAAKALRKGTKT